jgi:hypothetical protein
MVALTTARQIFGRRKQDKEADGRQKPGSEFVEPAQKRGAKGTRQARTWISLEPGYRVRDEYGERGELTIVVESLLRPHNDGLLHSNQKTRVVDEFQAESDTIQILA